MDKLSANLHAEYEDKGIIIQVTCAHSEIAGQFDLLEKVFTITKKNFHSPLNNYFVLEFASFLCCANMVYDDVKSWGLPH